MKVERVALIGLNHVTASIGLALRAAMPQLQRIGYDADPELARQAQVELGAIDRAERQLAAALADADLVLMDQPAAQLEATFQALGDTIPAHALILDLSLPATRGAQLARRWLPRGYYVGVRPVLSAAALDDTRELQAAQADLFANSLFCLMPMPDLDPQAVETAVRFGRLLGAQPYFLTPDEFDALQSGVEVMPGLLAAAAFAVLRQTPGWQDMVRLADRPFAQMTAALQPGDALAQQALMQPEAALRWIDAVTDELQTLRRLIAGEQRDVLAATLTEAAEWRARWLAERAKNSWVQLDSVPIEQPGFMRQMLGGWLGGRRKSE